jgi:hypothetical protein
VRRPGILLQGRASRKHSLQDCVGAYKAPSDLIPLLNPSTLIRLPANTDHPQHTLQLPSVPPPRPRPHSPNPVRPGPRRSSFGGSDASGDPSWPRTSAPGGGRYRPQPLGPETQQLDLLVDTLQAVGGGTPVDGGGGDADGAHGGAPRGRVAGFVPGGGHQGLVMCCRRRRPG